MRCQFGVDRLSMSVTQPDGRVIRWGPDAPEPSDIPGDLTFSTSIPGGFKDLQCSLLRRIDLDYSDQGLFDMVRVYGPGNRTAWEGTQAQFPRSHGQGYAINPGAVGHVTNLEDWPGFREVYVDRDVSHWEQARLARQASLAGSSILQGGLAWQAVNGGLMLAFSNDAIGNPRHVTELWYEAPAGTTVETLMYKAQSTGTLTSWTLAFYTATDDAGGGTTGIGSAVFTDTLTTENSFTPRRYVYLQVDSGGNSVTPTGGTSRRFTHLAAYGNHGITLRTITGEPSGVYASDVIEDIVTRGAPLLTVGEIEATSFAIPHLVFLDPTKPSDAIATVNAYHLYDWGVYDNREFFYRAPDPDRLTWEARLDRGAHLEAEGDTAAQVFNGVIVHYTDPLGLRRVAGPPDGSWPGGVALADSTNAALVDASETNPLNAWGRRKWGELSIGFPTTSAGAEAIGAAWLAERSLAGRRGTLTLTGTIEHPLEGDVPVWRVRAGDFVTISDHPASVPRRIIETRYTHSTRSIVLSLDNTNFKLESILERLGVQLIGVV